MLDLPSNGSSGATVEVYGGKDPADLPRYSYEDARRATQVPASTIAAWVRGMTYRQRDGSPGWFKNVIDLPADGDRRLSFNNLLEVNSLRALRETHKVRLDHVREAIQLAREQYGVGRPLISPELYTSGGRIFLDRYFELVELSPSRQLAMRTIMEHFLRRVRKDAGLNNFLFFPVPRYQKFPADAEPLLVSPVISFGNAIVGRVGVSTHAVSSRYDIGEPKEAIIADYRLTEDEFEEAILYESAAA
jgi:uncharacterized protein (DUF433 family)